MMRSVNTPKYLRKKNNTMKEKLTVQSILIHKQITTEQKEIENLKVLLGEKEHKINIIEETFKR